MHSKNSYTGINPKVVKHIRHYAKLLKRGKAFAYKDIEDVEQDLLYQVPLVIKQMKKSSFCL